MSDERRDEKKRSETLKRKKNPAKTTMKSILVSGFQKRREEKDPHWDLKTTPHIKATESSWQEQLDQLRVRFEYINAKHIILGGVVSLLFLLGFQLMRSYGPYKNQNIRELSAKSELNQESVGSGGKKLRHVKKGRRSKKSSLHKGATRANKVSSDRHQKKHKKLSKKRVKKSD